MNSTLLTTIYKAPIKVIKTVYKPLDFIGDKVAKAIFNVIKVELNGSTTVGTGGGGGGGTRDISFMSFITSKFAITMVMMMILVNRIHHLVPPIRPNSFKLNPYLKIALRLPSLLLLLRSILLISSILGIQNGFNILNNTFLVYFTKLIGYLTLFAGKSTLVKVIDQGGFENMIISIVMGEVFLSTATAIITEAFVRALDDDLPRQGTFNILSFAFLLHVHSTPSAKPSPFPTQIYIHILLILLEIFSLHVSYTFSSPPVKLYITATFSLIGQGFIIRGARIAWKNKESILLGGAGMEYGSRTWDSSVFFSRLPELMFEAAILLTISLRLIAALLRQEPITKELIFGHSSHYPLRTDDWSLGMIKYGSSCLEHTRLAGLSNEVDPITFSSLNIFSSSTSTTNSNNNNNNNLKGGQEISYVELTRSETSGLIKRRKSIGIEEMNKDFRKKGKGKLVGFGNEIIAVDVRARDLPGDPMARDPNKFAELRKFFKLVWRIIYFIGYTIYHFILNQFKRFFRLIGLGNGDIILLEDNWKVLPNSTTSTNTTIEEEEDGDEEGDEDYSPSRFNSRANSPNSDSDSNNSNSEEEEESGEEEEEEERFDSTLLYQDLTSPVSRKHQYQYQQSSPIASTSNSIIPYSNYLDEQDEEEEEGEEEEEENYTPILLAHHLNSTNKSPLTRRKYQLLLNPSSPSTSSLSTSTKEDSFSTALLNRRQSVLQQHQSFFSSSSHNNNNNYDSTKEEEAKQRSRTCVICTLEERTIITWPCRCLSLCEDCREEISKRSNENSHLCPVCRTKVKGFSRIFIP